MALGTGIQYGPLIVFHAKVKKGNFKKCLLDKSIIMYSQLFQIVEKWVQTGFSFVLKMADNFDWTLKCKSYKVLLTTFSVNVRII